MKILQVLFLCCLCLTPSSALRAESREEKTKRDFIKLREGRYKLCRVAPPKKSSARLDGPAEYGLFKQDFGKSGNLVIGSKVANLKVEKGGATCLILPESFKALTAFTEFDADNIFGFSLGYRAQRSYFLKTKGNDTFELKVQFKGKWLSRYQLVCPYGRTNWIEVRGEGAE